VEPERWSAIDELFSRVLEVEPGERRAFLDDACGDDAALRVEVEELLAADERARTFLESPAAPTFLDGDAEEPPAGARFGPYRIERLLGRGGMGTVWLATRDDGQFERQVALKLLHRGAGDPEALQRFRAERQILARLEHPAIARLYDGGETADGVPFLVMEYVEGLPLDVYCDRNRLGLEDRLRLFRRLLDAVAYAHQNLLVHRDIKPQNILVTAQGEPKLLDFGIAKQLVETAGGAEPAPTGLRPMTPSYASPEQVRGEAVTTASDVYSLGVVLYELLCGRSPYRLQTGLPHELEAAILDQEPEKPSQALARAEPDGPSLEKICAARRARPRELRRRLTGDLDTLTLTALRKEPQRRYHSIVELAADIDNHLRNLPIAARPDTVLYRTGKLVRRHRLAVALAGAALLAIAALFGSLLQQRDRAERDHDKMREALYFLVDVFENADPYEKGAENVSTRELLEIGAQRVSEELAGEPEVQASLLYAIGQVSYHLGLQEEAAPLLERALALRRQTAPNSLDLAASLESVAWLKVYQGDHAAAEQLSRESLALRQRLPGNDAREAAKSLQSLAMIAQFRGDFAEAEGLIRQALQIRRERLGRRHRDTLRSEQTLAQVLIEQSRRVMIDHARLAEAEELLHHALTVQREILPQPHPHIAFTVHDLALLRSLLGDYTEAEALFRETLAFCQAIWGETNANTMTVLSNVGSVLLEQGTVEKLKEAEHLFETALSIQRPAHGERRIDVATNLERLALVRSALGRHDEALAGARQALDIKRRAEDPDLARPLRDLGIVLLDAHRPSEAEPYLRQSLKLLRRTNPPGYFETARIEVLLGACLTELGRYAEAEPFLRQGTRRLEEQLPAGHKLIREARDKTAALQRARAAKFE
jgi:eukaryotic-like serine/threonine-protein kinase